MLIFQGEAAWPIMIYVTHRVTSSCQGYGDVLAGTLGTLLAWSKNRVQGQFQLEGCDRNKVLCQEKASL